MATLVLHVLTPEKACFEGAVKSFTAPGEDGRFGVLPNHAAIIAALREGELHAETEDGKKMTIKVPGGFLELKKNEAVLLADSAEIIQ